MIKYKLVCNKCKNTFDSWFASSKEFEKLKKKKFLSCITCNSNNVDKSLIGGLVLQVGSTMIDSSIKTKLNSLKMTMKGV